MSVNGWYEMSVTKVGDACSRRVGCECQWMV